MHLLQGLSCTLKPFRPRVSTLHAQKSILEITNIVICLWSSAFAEVHYPITSGSININTAMPHPRVTTGSLSVRTKKGRILHGVMCCGSRFIDLTVSLAEPYLSLKPKWLTRAMMQMHLTRSCVQACVCRIRKAETVKECTTDVFSCP